MSLSIAGRRFPLAFQAIQAGHGGFLQSHSWAEVVLLGLGLQAPADPTAAPETEGPEAWLVGQMKLSLSDAVCRDRHFLAIRTVCSSVS